MARCTVSCFLCFASIALLIDHSIEGCSSRGRLGARDLWREKQSPIEVASPFVPFYFHLVHLLLLIEADLAGTHVDEEEQTANNGEDLEEVVLGEVLVRVVLVKL